MVKLDSTKKRDIAAILNKLLYSKVTQIKNTPFRVRLTLAIMKLLDVLENEPLHRR